MQTAVEWLIEQISEKQPNGFYVIDTLEDVAMVFKQAKEMEKQMIIDAHHCGRTFENKYPESDNTYNQSAEKYYQETFKKD